MPVTYKHSPAINIRAGPQVGRWDAMRMIAPTVPLFPIVNQLLKRPDMDISNAIVFKPLDSRALKSISPMIWSHSPRNVPANLIKGVALRELGIKAKITLAVMGWAKPEPRNAGFCFYGLIARFVFDDVMRRSARLIGMIR